MRFFLVVVVLCEYVSVFISARVPPFCGYFFVDSYDERVVEVVVVVPSSPTTFVVVVTCV